MYPFSSISILLFLTIRLLRLRSPASCLTLTGAAASDVEAVAPMTSSSSRPRSSSISMPIMAAIAASSSRTSELVGPSLVVPVFFDVDVVAAAFSGDLLRPRDTGGFLLDVAAFVAYGVISTQERIGGTRPPDLPPPPLAPI